MEEKSFFFLLDILSQDFFSIVLGAEKLSRTIYATFREVWTSFDKLIMLAFHREILTSEKEGGRVFR